jgi:cephalosporin hydroxylase
VIVETGTNRGGTSLFLATMCDLIGHGRVISIDITEASPELPVHERVQFVGGVSSTDPALDLEALGVRGRVMVILDSGHRRDHVRAELERYAPLVAPGCYLVVEDTCLNGHPVLPDYGPGPMEALELFVTAHPEFEIDRERERNLLTFHPRGFLRRRPDEQG